MPHRRQDTKDIGLNIYEQVTRGVVISTKMSKTIIVCLDYLHWIAMYKRFEEGNNIVQPI
jgi:ribosomal protein S17